MTFSPQKQGLSAAEPGQVFATRPESYFNNIT
jgi:hypothetical protein